MYALQMSSSLFVAANRTYTFPIRTSTAAHHPPPPSHTSYICSPIPASLGFSARKPPHGCLAVCSARFLPYAWIPRATTIAQDLDCCRLPLKERMGSTGEEEEEEEGERKARLPPPPFPRTIQSNHSTFLNSVCYTE